MSRKNKSRAFGVYDIGCMPQLPVPANIVQSSQPVQEEMSSRHLLLRFSTLTEVNNGCDMHALMILAPKLQSPSFPRPPCAALSPREARVSDGLLLHNC